MPNIHVDPALIQEAENRVNDIRTAFEEAHATAKNAVMNCGWEGAAAEAFNARFEEANTQFEGVKEQITGIANMLKSGRDGLVTTDEQIASGMSG
jgi:WXG100 family type VII secretion target